MMQCYSVVACLFVHQDQLPRGIRVTSGTSVCPKNYAHGSTSPPIDFTMLFGVMSETPLPTLPVKRS